MSKLTAERDEIEVKLKDLESQTESLEDRLWNLTQAIENAEVEESDEVEEDSDDFEVADEPVEQQKTFLTGICPDKDIISAAVRE